MEVGALALGVLRKCSSVLLYFGGLLGGRDSVGRSETVSTVVEHLDSQLLDYWLRLDV